MGAGARGGGWRAKVGAGARRWGPKRVVGGRDASDRGRDRCGGPRRVGRGARPVVGAPDGSEGGPVTRMGAMEDGRCERGLEGMGWGLGCMGRARDV